MSSGTRPLRAVASSGSPMTACGCMSARRRQLHWPKQLSNPPDCSFHETCNNRNQDIAASVTPRVFNVPPDLAFLPALARAILAGGFPLPGTAPPDFLELPRWTILLPSRRAARSLQQAFLE